MEGTSLRPLLAADGADREAFAQTYFGEGLVAPRSGPMKCVFKPERPTTPPRGEEKPPFADAATEWLFDVAADPRETRNLATIDPARLVAMRTRIQAWLQEQERRGHDREAELQFTTSGPVRVKGDPQLERQLRALGYLE